MSLRGGIPIIRGGYIRHYGILSLHSGVGRACTYNIGLDYLHEICISYMVTFIIADIHPAV